MPYGGVPLPFTEQRGVCSLPGSKTGGKRSLTFFLSPSAPIQNHQLKHRDALSTLSAL